MTIQSTIQQIIELNPHQPEFHQAVTEVYETLENYISENPKYNSQALLHRLSEPDRAIMFRVTWVDDAGDVQVNKWYRVQFNNCIWPYKWWLRFHPSVNLSILKFLWFEQIFKNALTGLPLWWGKWGSDFDPKGKSDAEVMRFCQAFMSELYRHIWPDVDVPAGDIGVGAREIGYMFGMYRKIRNEWTGTLTGKWIWYGWSLGRTEATWFGLIYFVQHALQHIDDEIKDKTIIISWSGNVAQHAIQKAVQLWATVISASDSDGTLVVEDGFTDELIAKLKEHKNIKRWRLSEFAKDNGLTYLDDQDPWWLTADIALPCATQNEIDTDQAKTLVDNGVMMLAEWANMPTTASAIHHLTNHDVIVIPGKASNAWWVAVSWLEMSQNSSRVPRTSEQVDEKLQSIMADIHAKIVEHGTHGDSIDYIAWANIAWFARVADAMLAQWIV